MISEPRSQWQNLILAVLLGILFTLGAIQFSYNYGRLLLRPQYDDIGYIRDILWRMDVWAHDGFAHWAQLTWQSLPESLLIYILGTVGYYLSPSQAAPYYASGILLIAFLFGVLTIFGRAGLFPRLAILVFTLSLPFSPLLVTEFRPDPAWGIALGFALLLTLYGPTSKWTGRRMWGLALLYGSAFIIKPHISPITLFHMGLALGLRGLYEVLPWRGWDATRQIFFSLVKIAALSFLVALPVYIFILQRTWDYFYGIAFGQYSGVWGFHGNFSQFFPYYLRGTAATSNIGRHFFWPLMMVPCVGMAVAFFRKDKVTASFGFLTLLTMWLSLLVTVAGKQINPFFAGPLYVMLIGLTVYWLGHFYRWLEQRRPIVAGTFAALLLVFSLCLARWPSTMHVGLPFRPYVVYNHRFDDEIFQTVLANKRNDGTTKVFFAAVGPVFAPDLAIWAMQNHLAIEAEDPGLEAHPDVLEGKLTKADIAIVQEKGLYGAPDYIPDEVVQDQLLDWVRQQKDMQQVAEFGGPDGRAIAVFVHRQKQVRLP
jgi:hypothetical protein